MCVLFESRALAAGEVPRVGARDRAAFLARFGRWLWISAPGPSRGERARAATQMTQCAIHSTARRPQAERISSRPGRGVAGPGRGGARMRATCHHTTTPHRAARPGPLQFIAGSARRGRAGRGRRPVGQLQVIWRSRDGSGQAVIRRGQRGQQGPRWRRWRPRGVLARPPAYKSLSPTRRHRLNYFHAIVETDSPLRANNPSAPLCPALSRCVGWALLAHILGVSEYARAAV